MSDIFGAVAGGIGAAANAFGPLVEDAVSNFALIGTSFRNIGGLYPDVTVEEIHRDELQITQHPVEIGAPISDHAFMQPTTVEIRCGWSNSSAQSEGYVQSVYDALQQLQTSVTPFDVTTGKRFYQNQLVRSLMVRTDVDSEYALMVVALCQQVIITSGASTSSSPPNTNGSPSVAAAPAPSLAQPGANPSQGFVVQGGAASAPIGSISPDANGNYGFSASPYNVGSQILAPAPPGAPTVESLQANQGI